VLSAELKENKLESFRELLVWQRSMQLTNVVYDLALKFPKEEMFGLSSQMRRVAVSVASNIAEGSQRGGKKEFIHFLTIARGSLAELLTQLILACDRKFISQQEYNKTHDLIDEVSRMSMRLIQSLKR
jgi:four helix bundle protein